MNSSQRKPRRLVDALKTGLFSKQEGAETILTGIRHVHSSILGVNDPCWKHTEASLAGFISCYPWEIAKPEDGIMISQSTKRSDCLELIASSTQFGHKSQNRERLRLVLEELLSNAFYHAYKNKERQDKYDRLLPATLMPGEEIRVSFGENASGLHLVVEDQAGTLAFEDFKKTFTRCFRQTQTHISFDDKHAGAGLGLYMVYEIATHLCVVVEPGKKTRFSIWLSNSNQFDPDSFSFNFFEE